MITLQNDTLTFAFPEIARQVQRLAEDHIQKLASELPPEWDREEIIESVATDRNFEKLTPANWEKGQELIRTWTSQHVIDGLRQFIAQNELVNSDAFTKLTIRFQRTMRLPDDGQTYRLPSGLGQFPLRRVEDFPHTAPNAWKGRGDLIMPMYESDGVLFCFSSSYRFAARIGTGLGNIVTVPISSCDEHDSRRYLLLPRRDQANRAIHLEIVPLKASIYYDDENAFFLPPNIPELFKKMILSPAIAASWENLPFIQQRYCDEEIGFQPETTYSPPPPFHETARKHLLEIDSEAADRDQTQTAYCIIHICDATSWEKMTGLKLMYPPLTMDDYQSVGLPWFENYT